MISKEAAKRAFAIGAVLAVGAAPAALAERPADPGSQGQGHSKEHGKGHESEHGKSGAKTVMYVFKGTYAGAGDVAVDHGNAHVRKAGLVGATVSFDLTAAKIVVADNDGNGTRDLADVRNDDRVVVKARLPRTDPGAQPYTAKQLVDQTHAATGP